jgi:hypothetical protein
VGEKFDIQQNCFMGTDFHVSMDNNHWMFLDLVTFNVPWVTQLPSTAMFPKHM